VEATVTGIGASNGAGGIARINKGTISDCHFTGDVVLQQTVAEAMGGRYGYQNPSFSGIVMENLGLV
jgi:hypothetical protein